MSDVFSEFYKSKEATEYYKKAKLFEEKDFIYSHKDYTIDIKDLDKGSIFIRTYKKYPRKMKKQMKKNGHWPPEGRTVTLPTLTPDIAGKRITIINNGGGVLNIDLGEENE